MVNLKLFTSAVLAAGLCGLPLAAQQSPSPATPGDQPQQSTPGGDTQSGTAGQAMPGNHSDPNATVHTGSGDGQKPTNDNPDPGAGQGTGNANPKAEAVPVQHTATAPEVANAQLRPVKAELVNKLDAKNAKAGDQVLLKTIDKAAMADGTVIPKGSKIKGQVVDVKPHDGANKNSQVTLQFTQAQLKNGQTIPIKSVLQSVSPSGTEDASAGSAPMPSGVMGSGGASAQNGPVTSAGSGAASANSGSAMSGAGGVSGSQTAQAQGSVGASQSTVASGANGAPAPGTVVAQQGNIQVKTTAVPGVLVETNADGQPFANASGALLGAGQNVHLDGGTRMDLAIAQANKGRN